MKKKNPVAKFQRRFNRAVAFLDRKKEEKKNPKMINAEYISLESDDKDT